MAFTKDVWKQAWAEDCVTSSAANLSLRIEIFIHATHLQMTKPGSLATHPSFSSRIFFS